MNLHDLEANNQATLKALRELGKIPGDAAHIAKYPYFGFYEVDLFDCPPFLMFTNNDCPRGWNILFERYFEPHSMKLWCQMARRATGILDIGAHVGVYSLAAAALRKDITIHAFEPNPYAFARLRMHKLVNGFSNIEEHTFAVGDRSAAVAFGWAKKATLQIASGASVGERKGERAENTLALMRSLDETGAAATLGNRGLVKIDVEGGEIAALTGMQQVLALKPDIILETFSQGACDVINPMIAALGYRSYRIAEKAGHLIAQDKLYPCEMTGEDFNQLLTVREPNELLQS